MKRTMRTDTLGGKQLIPSQIILPSNGEDICYSEQGPQESARFEGALINWQAKVNIKLKNYLTSIIPPPFWELSTPGQSSGGPVRLMF